MFNIKNKDINTTLIIWNGFDLNLGMNTGYKAFYDQLEKNKFWEKHSNNSLLKYIKDKGGNKYFWYDFETIILHYTFESEQGKKLIKLEKIKNPNKKLTKDIVSEVKEGVKLLKEELVKFLAKAKPNNKKLVPAYRIFAAVLGACGENEDELITSLLKRKDKQSIWKFPNNKIISFNYLDDPFSLSVYLQFFINNIKVPCTPPIGIKAADLENMFVFLHRSLDFQNKSNIHPGIVFGTNDDERMPKALYFLRKSHQLGNNAKMHFLDTLNKSKRIVIFGLSLIGIDFDYFKEFFESTKNCDIEVVIINKKNALDNIRKELQKIGCKKQIYYLDFEKDNIDKNVLCLNKELRYRNFSDLCKIIANDSIDSEHINKVEVQNTFNLILK